MDPAMQKAEMGSIIGLAIFALVALVSMLAYRRFLLKRIAERRDEFAKLAEMRNMEFHPGYTSGLPLLPMFGFYAFVDRDLLAERLSEWLGFFAADPHPVLAPVLFKATDGMEWFVIDYATDYSSFRAEPSKKDSLLHKSITIDHYSIVIVRLPMLLPAAQIHPSSKLFRVRVAAKVPPFRTESKEFNDKFVVWTYEPARMNEVLHPLTITELLSEPTIGWEMSGPYLMAYQPGHVSAEGYGELLDRVQTFIDLIPDYMQEDHGFDPNEQEQDEFEEV